MAGNGATKDNEKRARQNYAARHGNLRDTKFELVGFKSNVPVPDIKLARSLAETNRRKMAGRMQRERDMQTPSVTQ